MELATLLSSRRKRQATAAVAPLQRLPSPPPPSAFANRGQQRPVVSCLASCGLALAYLHGVFLRPLRRDAVEMHRQQLDPTEIVAIPYDLHRLALFVAGTAMLAAAMVKSLSPSPSVGSATLTSMVRNLCGSDAPLVWLAMVLCGTPPTENVGHTVSAAIYLATLATALDPPHFPPRMCGRSYSLLDRLYRPLPPSQKLGRPEQPAVQKGNRPVSGDKSRHSPDEISERQSTRGDPLLPSSSSSMLTLCVVALNVPLAVLRLYDRGWQYQRWPVPIIVATTYGWVLGNLLGTLVLDRVFWVEEEEAPSGR